MILNCLPLVVYPSMYPSIYLSIIFCFCGDMGIFYSVMRNSIKTVLEAIRRIVPGAQYIEDPLSNERIISIVRGPNSMRNQLGPPLFIIDDIPYESGVWVDDFLSMDDVAELRVDRDGSGYGARGANGVVIIRTLRGSDR